jgi:threonine dehydrogenase-like Zn-dependent dehydrogenase
VKITEARLVGPEKLELVSREIPPLAGDQVLVRVCSCGVCTSEMGVWLGRCQGTPGVSFRYAEYPCSLGHEVTGVIEDVGPEAKRFQAGDRVTGVAYARSGFATHVVEPESRWLPVPRSVPLELALGEPLMAATNIVRMAAPDFGDAVVLVGDGFMSLLVTAALARYPLEHLIVIGHHDSRLAMAKELGASRVINGHEEDPYWATRKTLSPDDLDATPWLGGADILFEFAGRMEALQLAASLGKPKQRAKLMLPSFYDAEPLTIGHYLMNRGPSLIVCHPAHSLDVTEDLDRAIWALDQGVFPMESLVTHAFGLDAVGAAMEASRSRLDGYIKGIVVSDPSLTEAPGAYLSVESA